MIGSELRDWRKRNRFTQDMLRGALGLGSRQTIISWQKSARKKIPRMAELALLALEHVPGCRYIDGHRYTAAEKAAIHEHVHGS